jgi:hypothetical protein
MGRQTLAVLVLLAGCAGSGAGREELDNRTGLMYGPGHAYMFDAPEGWVLDNEIGRSRGLFAVFYPAGETWGDTEAFMYVNTVGPGEGDTASVAVAARNDSMKFVADNPGITITVGDPITLPDGRQAIVRYFTGDRFGNYEAAAYVPEKKITPIFILSSRTVNAFERALPAFRELVRSYKWVGDRVRIPPDSVR